MRSFDRLLFAWDDQPLAYSFIANLVLKLVESPPRAVRKLQSEHRPTFKATKRYAANIHTEMTSFFKARRAFICYLYVRMYVLCILK